MPLQSALIMTPIRFAATSYVVQAVENTVTTNLNFPATGSLTVGRNYWLSGDGQADADGGVGGVGDLIEMLRAALQFHGEPQTFTGALTSFRAVFASTDNFRIMWAEAPTTLDETIFGFTNANTSNATSATSPNQPQGIWRPKKPIQNDSRERQPVVGGVSTAISGIQRVSALALPKKERDLDFKFIVQAQTLQEYELADEPYGSFEEAWINSIRLGRAFRYYPDETVISSSSYQLYYTRSLEDPMKRNDQFRIYWDIALKARAV